MQLGALAERYFRDDPGTAIFKLRQFAELLSKTIAARHALYLGERETFEDTLRRLAFERIIPKEVADVFTRCARPATGQRMRRRQSHRRAVGAEIRAPAWHLVSPHLRQAGRFQAGTVSSAT